MRQYRKNYQPIPRSLERHSVEIQAFMTEKKLPILKVRQYKNDSTEPKNRLVE